MLESDLHRATLGVLGERFLQRGILQVDTWDTKGNNLLFETHQHTIKE